MAEENSEMSREDKILRAMDHSLVLLEEPLVTTVTKARETMDAYGVDETKLNEILFSDEENETIKVDRILAHFQLDEQTAYTWMRRQHYFMALNAYTGSVVDHPGVTNVILRGELVKTMVNLGIANKRASKLVDDYTSDVLTDLQRSI